MKKLSVLAIAAAFGLASTAGFASETKAAAAPVVAAKAAAPATSAKPVALKKAAKPADKAAASAAK